MRFENSYRDARRAAAYDQLELGGTYHLAFRDTPRILADHVRGKRALDFGCGTGRSARYLQGLGFEVVGVDISEEMVAVARNRDPNGNYRVIGDGDFEGLPEGNFDLVLCAFTFDNIPTQDRKTDLFRGLKQLLAPRGRILNIVSTAEMYTHEWATFTTSAYPENRLARRGDVVRVVTTDHSDSRPVEDIFWPHEDYLAVYRDAGLRCFLFELPLATGNEAIRWRSETTVAPWAMYVLGHQVDGLSPSDCPGS